ncbi:hypothetical protein [Burkholderia pyrrocinia]|nr:hypothetical protein [Burkholderia pyrrocinia]
MIVATHAEQAAPVRGLFAVTSCIARRQPEQECVPDCRVGAKNAEKLVTL